MFVQPCRSTCGVQVWSTGMVIDGWDKLVLMDRERWRATARYWLTNQSNRVTSRDGWHLGHALAWGDGGVDRVADVVEDWRDTCLVVEDVHEMRCSLRGWASNHPALRMMGFAEFGPQNSASTVPETERTVGGTWRDHRRCVKAKQLRMKDVIVGSKSNSWSISSTTILFRLA
jgi:hypothetical protein